MKLKKSEPITIKGVIDLLLRYPNQNKEIANIYVFKDEICLETKDQIIYIDYNGYEEYGRHLVPRDLVTKLP